MTPADPRIDAPQGIPTHAFVGILLAASLAPLGSTMIAVALPAIATDLDIAPASLTQWLATSYVIVSMAFQTPGGKLGDRIGHRRNLWLGLVMYAVGAAFGLAMAALPALVIARIAMAGGSALILPSAVAEIRVRLDAQRRGRAFGYFGAAMGVAAALGPLLGGELTQRFGWHALFLAPLPQIGLAALLVRGMPRSPHREHAVAVGSFDLVGVALMACGVALAAAGLGGQTPAPALLGGTGVGVLALFVLWERRVAEPIFDVRLFRRRVFSAGGAIIALNNLAMYALLFQLPIYFQRVHPGEAAELGRSLMAMMVAMVVGSPLGARLAERIGARATVTLGVVLSLASVWRFMDLTAMRVPSDAVLALALLGAGIGIVGAPAQSAAMNAVEPHEAGMAAGVSATLRYVGGVVGIALLGVLLGTDTEHGDLSRHLAPMPFYAGALAISLLAAQVLPGRSTTNAELPAVAR